VPLLFPLNGGHACTVGNTVLERLQGLIDAAVSAGRFRSRADFLAQAGRSRGYLGELRARLEKRPDAGLHSETAQRFAQLLGMSTDEFMETLSGERAELPPASDKYPSRPWAITAARALQIPEQAIQAVLAEDPGHDPGRWYWFRRLESEAARVKPASGL